MRSQENKRSSRYDREHMAIKLRATKLPMFQDASIKIRTSKMRPTVGEKKGARGTVVIKKAATGAARVDARRGIPCVRIYVCLYICLSV